MGLTRNLIDWCDTKFLEAVACPDKRKSSAKAFASGFVEGAMDAAVMMYIPVTIACWIWRNKATKK